MNAFFVGIGGMGMSGLAKILHTAGHKVAGSDRNLSGDYCQRLQKLGVKLYPQDGTGPELFMKDQNLSNKDFSIVKSTAVEDHVPDIVTAREKNIEQIMRSDLLASMFNQKKGLAIGGTAGKTTTTGLVAWILKHAEKDPSCAVGGIITGLDTNAFMGKGDHFVIESDESDGSIVKYRPYVSLVTNISRDHKPMEELKSLFTAFLNNTDKDGLRLVCGDDPEAFNLISGIKDPVKTYGISSECDICAQNIEITYDKTCFTYNNHRFEVKLPGKHNVLNTLGAIAIAQFAGLTLEQISKALTAFPGMKRRFEKIGTANGVTVIDDFAHNPAEIAAAINTARQASKNRFIVYQPHGFGPTRFTKNALIEVFSNLQTDEQLYLDDIFYGGGTVNKDISSKEIIDAVTPNFKNAFYFGERDKIVSDICAKANPGDMVLVMGARDINQICPQIIAQLTQTTEPKYAEANAIKAC
jgi:UDP-N-acetylmuramate--alanine ligase